MTISMVSCGLGASNADRGVLTHPNGPATPTTSRSMGSAAASTSSTNSSAGWAICVGRSWVVRATQGCSQVEALDAADLEQRGGQRLLKQPGGHAGGLTCPGLGSRGQRGSRGRRSQPLVQRRGLTRDDDLAPAVLPAVGARRGETGEADGTAGMDSGQGCRAGGVSWRPRSRRRFEVQLFGERHGVSGKCGGAKCREAPPRSIGADRWPRHPGPRLEDQGLRAPRAFGGWGSDCSPSRTVSSHCSSWSSSRCMTSRA